MAGQAGYGHAEHRIQPTYCKQFPVPQMDAINIAINLHLRHDDSYVRAFAALYASIRTHTTAPLHVFLLHDETLDLSNIRTLSEYIGRQDAISFIDINRFPDIATLGRRFGNTKYSPAVIWRIYLPDICPIDKVIVLDADLIFLCDIAGIWNTDLKGMAVSACLRGKPWPAEYHRLVATPPEKYFRCGVMVMNLKHIRRDANFMNNRQNFLCVESLKIEKTVPLPEQSIFNYFFSNACLPLEINLCRSGHLHATQEEIVAQLTRIGNMRNVVLDLKGWLNETPLASFYWSHLLLTPWHREAHDLLARRLQSK